MLAFAITALMLTATVAAVLTIADTVMQARVAYRRLSAELAVLSAEAAAHVDERLRIAPPVRAVTPVRRPSLRSPMLQRPVCAAA